MKKRTYVTPLGNIIYWLNDKKENEEITLIFLPGLTADHRLFDQQIAYFEEKYQVLVWDAPGHGESWPFALSFSLADKARWLREIMMKEEITSPVIVGQSMGGYVGQAFMEAYPGELKGFISVDSAPLQRRYVTTAEIWLLKRMEPFYRYYPWRLLLRNGSKGCAVSEYGRNLMRDMMTVYDSDKERYARLAGHGFKILAEAMEADFAYKIDCPVLLICGTRDRAGSTKRYNKAWQQISGIPVKWIEGAGHNSNTDQPQEINRLIEGFTAQLKED